MASHIDLNRDRGLDPVLHKKMMIGQDPRSNTLALAKARYPDAYGKLTAVDGWTDADGKFMRLSVFSAEALQAVWSGHHQAYTNPCISRNAIAFEGHYLSNYTVPKHQGRWEGKGPHLGWHTDHAASTIQIWRDNWLGSDPHQMVGARSTSYGYTDIDGAWSHGGYWGGIGIVGNNAGKYDPNYTEIGLQLWDEGEAATVGSGWIANCNGYGVEVIRGTPSVFTGTFSIFTCALGEICITGGELGTFAFNVTSGDNSPAMLVQRAGYGRGAGGTVHITLNKSESNANPTQGAVNKGKIAIWQQDGCVGSITITGEQSAMKDVWVDAPFVMKSRDWGQVLTVLGFTAWNHNTIVHDIRNQKRFAGAGASDTGLAANFRPTSFVWSDRNGGTFTDLVECRQIPGTPVNAFSRLGITSAQGQYDYARGLPAYSLTGDVAPPVPVACTGWAVGPWGPCVNGQQTRTVTATPAGCTGTPPNKPATTQACVIVPPMTATAYASSGTDTPDKAIDGLPGSHWLGTKPMTATGEQTFTLELGADRQASGITFGTNYFANSYPRKFDILTAPKGSSTWTTRVTNATGAQVSTAAWTAATVGRVRIVCRASNSNWWSISEVAIS